MNGKLWKTKCFSWIFILKRTSGQTVLRTTNIFKYKMPSCKLYSKKRLWLINFIRRKKKNLYAKTWMSNWNESITFMGYCVRRDVDRHRLEMCYLWNQRNGNMVMREGKKRLLIIYITCFPIMKQILVHPLAMQITDVDKNYDNHIFVNILSPKWFKMTWQKSWAQCALRKTNQEHQTFSDQILVQITGDNFPRFF